MESLPMYTFFSFSMLLNGNITDLEKPDRICLPTIVIDKLSGLLLHPSIFSSKYSRSA